MPDWREEHIAVQLERLGETLNREVTPETLEWSHKQLLNLTEALGALVEEKRTSGLPAPWDDPIWGPDNTPRGDS